MQDNNVELTVSNEVLEKMAELAACEIDGVAGLSKRAVDIKDVIKAKSAFKGVRCENVNGAVQLTVYICLKQDANAREVAESVQQTVKDKIQTMTGTVVTRVNVKIADIETEKAE